MRRREFILALGGAAAWPLAVRAQGERRRRIGVLMGWPESDHRAQSWVAALREELRKLGWTEGRNIEIDTRWAAADVEPMKRFAKELIALQPDLMVTGSTPATAAMLEQTHIIPIVFVLVADPVIIYIVLKPGGGSHEVARIALTPLSLFQHRRHFARGVLQLARFAFTA